MKSLYPFQEKTVQQVLAAPLRRLVINYETGLGKTAVAIMACRNAGAGRILVVTPAIVRDHWLEEFDSWWPGHVPVGLITMGRERSSGVSKRKAAERNAAYACPIQVVSYALLHHIDVGPWDAIIIDESHRIKSVGARQSVEIKTICRANPQAMILPLTATLMPDDICDVWNQLDTVWPDRFGKQTSKKYVSWSFANRYSLWEEKTGPNGEVYGGSFKGINKGRANELRQRLEAVSSRVTKHEVAHLLPPFLVKLEKVEPEKQVQFANVDDWLQNQGTAKIPFVLDWLEDALYYNSHVCILTHLRETVHALTRQIKSTKAGRDITIFEITGDDSPEVRNRYLAQAKANHGKTIVVATMHSIGIGIDLTFCPVAMFAELYWRPETIIQALGRFSRLSGKVPSSVTLLCLRNTTDEVMARSLMAKIDAITSAIKAGDSEERALSALDNLRMKDEEAIELLNKAISESKDIFSIF